MGSETACEESVAVCDMNKITLLHAAHGEGSAESIRPKLNVISRITYDLHLTGRSGRCVKSYELISGYCQSSERIIIAEVKLVRKGKLRYIVDTLDIVRRYACSVELLLVIRSILICALNTVYESLADEFSSLVFSHTFVFFIPDECL